MATLRSIALFSANVIALSRKYPTRDPKPAHRIEIRPNATLTAGYPSSPHSAAARRSTRLWRAARFRGRIAPATDVGPR